MQQAAYYRYIHLQDTLRPASGVQLYATVRILYSITVYAVSNPAVTQGRAPAASSNPASP